MRGTLRQIGSALGLSKETDRRLDEAQRALAKTLDDETRASTLQLLDLHGIGGDACGIILERVASHFELRAKVGEGGAALLGAVASGALTGLAADLATGGLTLGGGMIAGGLLGALGAAGVARGLNVVRGTGKSSVGWHAEAMTPILRAALLRYLAVAHFGRGRGQWSEGESPAHWATAVDAALTGQAEALNALWQSREKSPGGPDEVPALTERLQPVLAAAARATLEALYPGCWPRSDESPTRPTSRACRPSASTRTSRPAVRRAGPGRHRRGGDHPALPRFRPVFLARVRGAVGSDRRPQSRDRLGQLLDGDDAALENSLPMISIMRLATSSNIMTSAAASERKMIISLPPSQSRMRCATWRQSRSSIKPWPMPGKISASTP